MGIEVIGLSENQTSDVPDLEFLTKLKCLDLSQNHITSVQSVALYMGDRYRLWDNPITHIVQECFYTRELYDWVTRMIKNYGIHYSDEEPVHWPETASEDYPDTLVQPPVEVLRRGQTAVVDYFNHRLVSCCRCRYVAHVIFSY